jgi:hypothetical protein
MKFEIHLKVAIFLFAIDQSPLPAIIILSPVHQTGYML